MKRAIKVLIQTPDGWYFRGDKKDMGFTKARSKARVFDYDADRVQARLNRIPRIHGHVLAVVPVNPKDAYLSHSE